MILISVIVATYNRPDALKAVLEGYLAQSDPNFEVIIADDGSKEEIKDVVRFYMAKPGFSISHVWQEDQGYRGAAVRNRAIAASRADYIIFTDGDCIPLPDFVQQHRRLAEQGWFLVGKRILFSEEFTKRVLSDHISVHEWNIWQWLAARLQRSINRWLLFLHLPDGGMMRKLWAKRWQSAMTCNLSAWRSDLLRVNGMDEAFTGWGREDSDLVIRLIHAGVRRKSARFSVPPVLHLWHKQVDRSSLVENSKLLKDSINSKRSYAVLGVDQYL